LICVAVFLQLTGTFYKEIIQALYLLFPKSLECLKAQGYMKVKCFSGL